MQNRTISNTRTTPEQREARNQMIRNLYVGEGMSVPEICVRLGTSKTVAYNVIADYRADHPELKRWDKNRQKRKLDAVRKADEERKTKLTAEASDREDRNNHIVADYSTGKYSQRELARMYGISQRTIANVLNKAHQQPEKKQTVQKPVTLTEQQKREIAELAADIMIDRISKRLTARLTGILMK